MAAAARSRRRRRGSHRRLRLVFGLALLAVAPSADLGRHSSGGEEFAGAAPTAMTASVARPMGHSGQPVAGSAARRGPHAGSAHRCQAGARTCGDGQVSSTDAADVNLHLRQIGQQPPSPAVPDSEPAAAVDKDSRPIGGPRAPPRRA